ncbi:MAG: hypothetical protein DHS20C15_27610 [Planctomycetota bacterium]|nr:MAG: hypothetical protein DHS20C15_27610 [Planctomycetota bacterium]
MIAALLLACHLAFAPAATLAPAPALAPAPTLALALARQVDVGMKLTPGDAEVGLVMQLELKITGEEAADSVMLEIPETEGARLRLVSGPEQLSRMLRVNGRRESSIEVTWRVEVIPERAGQILIPPIRFRSRGADVFSDAFTFDVVSSKLPPNSLSISVTPSAEEVYIGQQIEVELEASVPEDYFNRRLSRGGLLIQIPWLDELRGFHRQPSPTQGASDTISILPSGIKLPFRVSRERRAGADHIVLRTQVPLLASSAGEYQLEPSAFRMQIAVQAKEDRDIFSRVTLVPTRVVEVTAHSSTPELRVKPTPIEGRPEAYVDAVGSFTLNGEVSPRSLAVGESCRLQLVLHRATGRPEGNLELLEWPDLEEQLGDFRIFGKEEFKQQGRRTLVFELSPRRADVTEVPQLALDYFDPIEEVYKTAVTGPFSLSVEAGVDLELPSLASADDRLADLDSIRVELSPPRNSLPWWWLMPVAGALLLLGVDVHARRRNWRDSHGGELRRRGARRALDAELAAANDAAGVSSAFARYLSARCGGPEAGYTREEAQRELSGRGHGELAQELGRVLEAWEVAYLGGGRLDVAEARDQARDLAHRVEALT